MPYISNLFYFAKVRRGFMKKRLLATILFVCLFGQFSVIQKSEASGRDVLFGAFLGIFGVTVLEKIVRSFAPQGQALQGDVGNNDTFFLETDFQDQDLTFVGQDRALSQVAEFVDSVFSFQKYKELGARKPRGLFIEGPSGNGKSLLAHIVAKELCSKLITVSGYFLSDDSIGPSEAKVRFIFDCARKAAQEKPTVLFIDDFDVFAQMSDFHRFNIQKRRGIHVFTELLESIDDEENLIVVVAASNSSLEFDPELLKPGVFDRVVHIPLPTRDGRASLISHYLYDVELNEFGWSDGFAEELLDQTAGFSALFLKELFFQAALIAGQAGERSISQEHLRESLSRVKEKKQEVLDQGQDELFYYTFSEKTKFKDVAGQEEVLVEVKEVVDVLKNPLRYTTLGARGPRGLLLHGPSGCGKTLIARAIAGEAGCCFISISGSEFVKKYVGTGAMTVRLIFNFARKMAKEVPVIIFIDEIDGLGHRKTLDSSGGQSEYNNTINELLKQMDGFKRDENIMVVGATNLADELDPALMRSGRFDRKVRVPLPAKQARQDILSCHLSKVLLDLEVTSTEIVSELAKRTVGFSGASLELLVNEAAMLAARGDDFCVRRNHFEEALDKIVLGVAANREQTAEALKRTAYHEAGHTLVAVLKGLSVTKVSILSRGNALGVTWTRNKGDEDGQCTKSELLHELMCMQAGYVAEKLVFGEVTPGVSDDLRRASEMASNMVKRFGMGAGDLECVAGNAIWSDAVRQRFDEAAIILLSQTFTQVKELVKKHKDLLVELAEKLLERETLSEQEVYAITGEPCG